MAKNNKTRFSYVLYSDKTWVFDQSERADGPIYVMFYNIFPEAIRRNKPARNVGRTLQKFVNHSFPARDLQAFLFFFFFSNIPRGFFTPAKPIGNVAYCLRNLHARKL